MILFNWIYQYKFQGLVCPDSDNHEQLLIAKGLFTQYTVDYVLISDSTIDKTTAYLLQRSFQKSKKPIRWPVSFLVFDKLVWQSVVHFVHDIQPTIRPLKKMLSYTHTDTRSH